MFSSNLESNPIIKFEGLDMVFELKGYDFDGENQILRIHFLLIMVFLLKKFMKKNYFLI